MNARDDRTAIRQQLYANGFCPLPNKNKMCLLKGWSTIDVTPQLIDDWGKRKADEQRFKDTGLRCGDIIALDWDIDDADLLNELLDEVVGQGLVEESMFVRIGRPPRELWVYRTADHIGKRTTGHFAPPGTEDGGFAVEVLGAGCQFAAFGQRDDTTEYTWPADSLLDHKFMDLPVITLEQVDKLKDFCVAFFENHGLERRSPGGGTDAGYSHAYDLTPDMLFDVKDLGEHTLAEIQDILALNPDEVLRCKVDTLRPTSGSWAGMISLVGGDVCVSDHGTYTTHFLIEGDLKRSVSVLGEILAKREQKAAKAIRDKRISEAAENLFAELDPRKPFDQNFETSLKAFVYVRKSDTVHSLAQPATAMSATHFRNAMMQYYYEEAGPRGGTKLVWLSDQWMKHPDRPNVETLQMQPGQPWPLYQDAEGLHLNTYRPLILPDNLGEAEPAFDMLERLLPIDFERKFFLEWLAHKVRHPEVRGPAVIMVAHDRYGTGRGSLISLIESMFAPNLVRKVDFKTLSGATYQSQYNEWLVDSLVVAVDEAQETQNNLTRWQSRSNAYEHLKTIVDPGESKIQVVRKGVGNFYGQTFASILVMTNHNDAIVIPPDDRRFVVLENGQIQPDEYWATFHAWRKKPENIAAFIAALGEIDLSQYDPFARPPMTRAKAEMIDAGSSDLDRALNHALAGIDNTLVVKDQIILKIEDYIAESDIEFPEDWRRMIERMLLRKTRKVPDGVPERVRVEGKQRVVRARGTVDAAAFATPENVLAELAKHGPVLRPVKNNSSVIKFPDRGNERRPA